MTISEWLDEKEAEGADVSHIALPDDLQYDEDRRGEITACLRQIFKEKTQVQWDAELSRTEVCHSVIANIEEVLEAPLFAERGMIFEYPQENGQVVKSLGVSVKLAGTPGSLRTLPVGFGENTREVLQELGYAAETIEDYYRRGIV